MENKLQDNQQTSIASGKSKILTFSISKTYLGSGVFDALKRVTTGICSKNTEYYDR